MRNLRILLTAFEPYDHWDLNSSWEAMVELLRIHGAIPGLTTRRYPVDLSKLQQRLNQDLELGFDAVLHLGQAPGISTIHLESIALNVAGITQTPGEYFGALIPGAPVAYRSIFPLDRWDIRLRELQIPSSISYHAGTYLCNAVMYLSHHWHHQRNRNCSIGFMHMPLLPEQVLQERRNLPWMKKDQLAAAIHAVLGQIIQDFETSWKSDRNV